MFLHHLHCNFPHHLSHLSKYDLYNFLDFFPLIKVLAPVSVSSGRNQNRRSHLLKAIQHPRNAKITARGGKDSTQWRTGEHGANRFPSIGHIGRQDLALGEVVLQKLLQTIGWPKKLLRIQLSFFPRFSHFYQGRWGPIAVAMTEKVFSKIEAKIGKPAVLQKGWLITKRFEYTASLKSINNLIVDIDLL